MFKLNFLYRLFKLNRKCYCCDCIDCQEKRYREDWWYCPHLKNNICDVCCTFDSLDPDWNWKECGTCFEEWRRVTPERFEKLGWEKVE
jgi:hypothetical protein